jgi:hypothetical protein
MHRPPTNLRTRFAWLSLCLVACAHRPWEDPGHDWKRVRSEHFIVDTDGDAADYEPVIGRLEDVHLALAKTFFEGLEVPRVRVLLFARDRDLKALTGQSKVDGFFDPALAAEDGGTLVFSSQTEHFDPVASTAAHELAHRFVHAASPAASAWLEEGFAKYVEAIELDDGVVVFDASRMPPGDVYFSHPVPFAELFAATELAFHGDATEADYMTSWLLVRHVLARPGRDATVQFRALLARTRGSPQTQAAAVSAAMDGLSIAEVEAQVVSTYRSVYWGLGQTQSRKTLTVSGNRAARSPLQVTPADPGEIRKTCRAARAGRTAPPRPWAPPPPPAPDPRDACFTGYGNAKEDGPKLKDEAAPHGLLLREDIRRVIRSHIDDVRSCYERRLMENPAIAGRVDFIFEIQADGTIGSSRVKTTTLQEPAVELCIGRAICRWVFPRPADDGRVIVTYPFAFQPTGEPHARGRE